MSEYKGNRWYKCDLHLHTMTSECYENKSDTPKAWVARALEQGLTAVAVTDHNDYRGIAPIMEEAKKQGLAVFPGVEITCDSSKIHMLILFDTTKQADNIRDFLNRCDIDSEQIGKSVGTSMSVFEICEIAKKRDALVIAAHIDEFSSINSMNAANLDKLINGNYIDAVQVANAPIWRKYRSDKDTDAMIASLQEKYGPGATPDEIDRWRKCYERAAAAGLPLLSFSDNPCAPNNSHHGLWGIGSNYTWIQMDESVDLESIRQSLITPESRIKMMCDSKEEPKTETDFWIRSIDIRNTELNPYQPIHIDFHPQLNCLIGGRGSGKSYITQILSAVYQNLSASILSPCVEQQNSLYHCSSDSESGILRENSEIDIFFLWFGTHYCLHITDIKSPSDQCYTLFSVDTETGKLSATSLGNRAVRSLLACSTFVENQIYQMAKTPGAFLNYVDHIMPDMYLLKNFKKYYSEKLVNLSLELHTIDQLIGSEERIQVEMDWLLENQSKSFVSESRREKFKLRIERRSKFLSMTETIKEDYARLQKDLAQYTDDYVNCLSEIRNARQGFLNQVFASDENYKITLTPFASRESFYELIKDLFSDNVTMLSEDFKKLESLLFAKNNGHSDYVNALKALRSPTHVATPGFSGYFVHLIQKLNDLDFERMLCFYPEDELAISYRPAGSKKYFPVSRSSTGSIISAIIAFALASDFVPLVIDQPEDYMDNRIIYDELIPKIKRTKQNRQTILITHNSNIATNADADMIISLDSKSKFTKVRVQGTLDQPEIRRELCDVLEGSQNAFIERTKKYHAESF